MPPKPPLLIRKAILDDAAGIAAVHVKAWQESYQGIIDQSVLEGMSVDEQRLSSWLKTLQKTNEGYFVACLQDKIIGFCCSGPSRSDRAKGEIYAIYILNAYKGRGAGYQLFTMASAYLRTQNLWPFITNALRDNKPARSFYERQGGKICGEGAYISHEKTYPEVCYLFE